MRIQHLPLCGGWPGPCAARSRADGRARWKQPSSWRHSCRKPARASPARAAEPRRRTARPRPSRPWRRSRPESPRAAPPALASGEAASRQTAKTGAGAVPIPTAQPIPAGSTTRLADDVVLVLAQSAIPDVVAAAAGANTAIPRAKAGEADALAGTTGSVEDDPEEPSSAAETAPSPGQSPATIVAPAPPIPVSSPRESGAGRVAAEPPSLAPGPITPPAAPAAAADPGTNRHPRRCCG